VQIEAQKQQEGAKPQLSAKTDEFAARYRAKQLSKFASESAGKQNDAKEHLNGGAAAEPSQFERLAKQQIKAASSWQEQAKKA